MRKPSSSLPIAGCFIAALAFACDESQECVYTARLVHLDDSGACLDAYAPIGLVEAEELGSSCDPVCLSKDGALYVSTVCPPYPDTAQLVDPHASVDCEDALALLASDASQCE